MNHQSFQIRPIWPARLHLGNNMSVPVADIACVGCVLISRADTACNVALLAGFLRTMSHGDER